MDFIILVISKDVFMWERWQEWKFEMCIKIRQRRQWRDELSGGWTDRAKLDQTDWDKGERQKMELSCNGERVTSLKNACNYKLLHWGLSQRQ